MTEMHTPSLSRLSMEEFHVLAALVFTQSGINLTAAKKVMLESRLNKRLRALKLESFKDYIHLLGRGADVTSELIHMIDVVTTNKTDFFREPHHFTYLENKILPELARTKPEVKLWSAACSSGEEPYTLAMVMEHFASQQDKFRYNIFASDISTTMLEKGALAIYPADKVECIPQEAKRRYLLKSRDLEKPTVRVAPSLRSKVRFKRINLMDTILPVDEIFDIIFCRNVLIYFDRKTQLEVVRKLTTHLTVGGYLFIGHSESLYQADLPLTQEKPTVYKKIPV
jgi:chemotaxis protein methyltransferase CheR